jgi:hypothetical protein
MSLILSYQYYAEPYLLFLPDTACWLEGHSLKLLPALTLMLSHTLNPLI